MAVAGGRAGRAWRIGWTITTIVAVQGVVCGLSALPVVFIWVKAAPWTDTNHFIRALVFALLAVPSYAVFGLGLMAVSPLANRLTRARTPPNVELRIADMDWALLHWVRAMVSTHLVRLFAGNLFRGSPIWTTYLRWSGARIGQRVYVNSLALSDYELLEFGDDVVIGGGVHLSGHTVEHGVLRTGTVRLGSGVTVGLGSFVDIDVEAGAGVQIGAMSLVPKHSRLEAGGVYAGVPVKRIAARDARESRLA